MSRYEERLQNDLNEIHSLMAEVATRVEANLANAIRSVLSGSEELAFATVLADEAINTRSRKIDQLCIAFIALHLPSAGHLRRISATLRANLQLERIGDYTAIISREGLQLSTPPTGSIATDLQLVATDGSRILHQAIAAFLEDNGDAARATQELAGGAQHTMDSIYEQLLSDDLEINTRDRIAYFAIYNQLKRLWDQAKNLCEETIFLVSGETKPKRIHSVLFIDEDNSALSQMAEAIGRKLYSDKANYASAGRKAAAALNPELVAFMDAHGYDLNTARLQTFPANPRELADYFVIISLEGAVRSFCPALPFHTTAFTWDVGAVPRGLSEAETNECYEEIYRELALRVRDLADRLSGEVN